MPLLALVDYDNVATERELSPDDVERNLSGVVDNLIRLGSAAKLLADRELRVRFYGGWISEKGLYSQRAEWLLVRISAIRGLRMGVRVLPTLAISVLGHEEHRLVGSLRQQRDFTNQATRLVQKMVDTMLAVDVLLLSEVPGNNFVVVSDDDDLVPALIASQRRPSPPARIIRRRELGIGLNDGILLAAKCRVERFPDNNK